MIGLQQRFAPLARLAWAWLLLLGGCGIAGPSQTPALRSVAATAPTVSGSAIRLFAVDRLVRSTTLSGVDMHVRYVEQTGQGERLHVAFYNNGTTDLAFISGIRPIDARLRGEQAVAPTGVSPTLAQGISPGQIWRVHVANNGLLDFPAVVGRDLELQMPGFPAVRFQLDLPLREAPEPVQPAVGTYLFNYEVKGEASQLLTIKQVTISTTAMTLAVTLGGELRAAAADEIVVLDGAWTQLPQSGHPPTARDGGMRMLTFPVPAGNDLIVSAAGFAPIHLGLVTGGTAAPATTADLPPSSVPRTADLTTVATPVVAAQDGTVAELNSLLVRITAAIEQRDRDAFVATFTTELQESQRTLFDRLMELPLTHVRFNLRIPGQAQSSVGRERADFVPVGLRYAIRELDPSNEFSNDLRLGFIKTDRWRIGTVAGDVPFWMYAPTRAQRSGPFWIFFHPPTAGLLPTLEAEAARAFRATEQTLPGRARAVNVMFVTDTAAEFTALTGRSGERFAGAALSRYEVNSAISITNQAFFLNGGVFRNRQPGQRQQVITHEFTHLVLAPVTMPYEPAWLIEGTAMLVAKDMPQRPLTDWMRTHRLEQFDMVAFNNLTVFGQDATDEETLFQYAYAAQLVNYVLENYGLSRLLQLYDAFAGTPFSSLGLRTASDGSEAEFGRLSRRLTDRYLMEVLGINSSELQKRVNRRISNSSGNKP
ncbi:MAG: hypothetical protein NVSMB42_22160 [Herpetosiphon sp.]